ncbi:DUF3021 family protein [Bifidobacterium sp. ESL0769]|uniref:DUF3021 family protein n=1 Tax=Bifidobacterium sp. ESL0769 TaxID=2983229 RepID=UPI0023F65697|nr:DUF3021 family protein [Bifidobacterium sp. ESL0769]WEV67109.1 DUF3021 family protein [Bifidobacterium sp. ESL0769]
MQYQEKSAENFLNGDTKNIGDTGISGTKQPSVDIDFDFNECNDHDGHYSHSNRLPTRGESWPRAILSYAIKGILFGSAGAVLIEIFIPGWIPITRLGMLTMLLIDALIGIVTLVLQRSDLPLFVIIPTHLICTLLICIGWIYINGWQWHVFHEELTLFVVGFIVVYVVIWAGILFYFNFIASNINRRLSDRKHMRRKN